MWWLKKTETEFKVNRRLSKMAVKDIEIIGQCENDCCCCSVAKLCLTLCNPMDSSTLVPLSSTVSQSFLKFMSIESVNVSNHLILCCPLLLLPSIFPIIRVFSNELSLCMRWPKYWSFRGTVLPVSIQGWFPLGLTALISLQPKGILRVFSRTTIQKRQFFGDQPSFHNCTWLLSAKWCLCFLIYHLGFS